MLRDEWVFEYTGKKLAEAAVNKRTHHTERAEWWKAQKEKVMEEVRSSGIEVAEPVAASYSNSTRGLAPQVMVRNDLQGKLTECHGKIPEHTGRVQEYDGWVQVLSVDPDARLKLHAEDYLFFFGK